MTQLPSGIVGVRNTGLQRAFAENREADYVLTAAQGLIAMTSRQIGQLGVRSLHGLRNFDACFTGVGSANTAGLFEIYLFREIERPGGVMAFRPNPTTPGPNPPADAEYRTFMYQRFAAGTFTLGTQTGIANGEVGTDEKFADTIDISTGSLGLTDWGTYITTKHGSSLEVHSGAADDIAMLGCADVGDHSHILIQPKNANTTSCNVLLGLGS